MKLYVAGKYQERDKIRLVFQELQRMGHTITLDWTNHDIYPNEAIVEKLGQFANDDVVGVKEADAVILCLINHQEYKGLWVEMGVALGAGKPVFIVGEAGHACIFTNHKLVTKFKSFQELYCHLGLPNDH